MATTLLEYDSKNIVVKKLLEALFAAGAKEKRLPTEEYDPEFVKKIRNAEKETPEKLDLKKYGITI